VSGLLGSLEGMSKDQVALGLGAFQKLIRRVDSDPPESSFHRWGAIPDDLATEEARQLSLTRKEHEAEQTMKQRLLDDPRFEHLGDGPVSEIDKALWRFVCLCALAADEDHVRWFMDAFGRDPAEHVYVFPVEFLSVAAPCSIVGVRLIPVDHVEASSNPNVFLGKPTGSVLLARAIGTSGKRMHDRARLAAEHALSILRVGLRIDNQITDQQLRFRLGVTYGVGERGGGRSIDPATPFEVMINEADVGRVTAQELASLSAEPTTNVEQHGLTALQWLNLGRLTPDPLNATLFDFFALEAILGDKAEGTKAATLSFRAAFLAHLDVGRYQDPSVVYWLYDEVRSAAVHGSARPNISHKDFYWFDRNVRESLNRALAFAREKGIVRQSELIEALDNHDQAEEFLRWLARDARWVDLQQARANHG
jgi:hypothetical protein